VATLTDDGTGVVLTNGVPMPLLGLGVWQIPDGRPTEQAVRWALDAGYRHIDTATLYRNERSVGRAIRDSGVPREQLFVATKFHPRDPDPERAVEASLRLLGLDHVDLYLWHWPSGGATRHWPAFERIAERGLARAVGVSNFSAGSATRRATSVSTRSPHEMSAECVSAVPPRGWDKLHGAAPDNLGRGRVSPDHRTRRRSWRSSIPRHLIRTRCCPKFRRSP